MQALLADAFPEFLKVRRAQMDAGKRRSSEHGRRVPGLRRQELAELAGLSVEYYTKLEQGRATNPSKSVLDAIADALILDRAERSYLYRVALLDGARPEQPLTLPAEVEQLVGSLNESLPAFVLTPTTDVVAWNGVGASAFGLGGPGEICNVTRRLFLDPDAQTLYGEWDHVVRDQVAWLRYDMAHHPDDHSLFELIEDMLRTNELFTQLWSLHQAYPRSHGKRTLNHPNLGLLDMFYTALPLPAEPRLTLITWSASKGSETAEKLRKLAELADVDTVTVAIPASSTAMSAADRY